MKQYDFVIIGSGLGGLTCGAILSKKGYSVCILEKNTVFGGCLQSYYRNGAKYETGVHYLGSLEKGQILNKLFNYLGILPAVEFERLGIEAFDKFTFGNNPEYFSVAQGYELFKKALSERFPDEKEGIEKYCTSMLDTCHRFPLYTFKGIDFENKLDLLYSNANDIICSYVKNHTLRAILAGNNPLYAGVADKTPFYIHALIINSLIESSWRCKDGGSSISKALINVIKKNGGVLKNNAEVKSFEEKDSLVSKAVTKTGEEYYGRNFISSLHPSVTLSLTASTQFRQIYRKRISQLENTTSPFILSIKLKPNTLPFFDYNHYHYHSENVWDSAEYTPEQWPKSFVLFTSTKYEGTNMAKTGCIMTYMNYSDVAKWENTFNTVFQPGSRGKDYEEFKQERVDRLLKLVEFKYPGITNMIEEYHAATPLTYRDYIGNPEGSLYGVLKDSSEPLKNYFPSKTKIPNLYLTGQNMSVHGVLGVAMSAVITCGEFLGLDNILTEVKNS